MTAQARALSSAKESWNINGWRQPSTHQFSARGQGESSVGDPIQLQLVEAIKGMDSMALPKRPPTLQLMQVHRLAIHCEDKSFYC